MGGVAPGPPAAGADAPPVAPPSPLLAAVRLRAAEAADVPAILGMVRELAAFEREPNAVSLTEAAMLADGFGAAPAFHVLLAEVPAAAAAAHEAAAVGAGPSSAPCGSIADAAAVGGSGGGAAGYVPVAMAFCHLAYSTWEGRVLYLEDLYVRPPFRRAGVSGLLFTALARAAAVARCARVQWTVLDWNEAAVTAYRRPAIAARRMAGWDIYRLGREDIARVAGLAASVVRYAAH